MLEEEIKGTPESFWDKRAKKISEFSFDGVFQKIAELEAQGSSLNKSLGLTKDRIIEIKNALGDTVPDFVAIGGTAADAEMVLGDLAEASRRSMLASDEVATQIFAATRMLKRDAETIATTFMEVGIGLERIPEELGNAMGYVRSIGGNANTVTQTVLMNMDKINRFQFEGGVIGLTKMAAQASMLRFDMGETFRLADQALNPEKAIELSSAFQRLGVSAGNLVDPFQLMQQSITDPQGLQDSIVNISKQFAYFDETSKSFKINPAGVLMLKEIESQTGLSAKELTKAGLAAKELDDRLSKISPEITFAKEEDKMYLANIAKMGEGGEYEVRISDTLTKKLSDVSQNEFNKLIEEQKNQPKNLEEVAYRQLSVSEKIAAGIDSLVDNFTYGMASSTVVSREYRGIDKILTSTVRNIQENVKFVQSENIRNTVDDALFGLQDIIKDLKSGKVSGKMFAETTTAAKEKFSEILKTLGSDMKGVLQTARNETTGGSASESIYNSLVGFIETGIGQITKLEKNVANTAQGTIMGAQPISSPNISSPKPQNMKVEFDNIDMNINLSLPDNFKNLSKEQIEKLLSDTFGSTGFKDNVNRMVQTAPSLKQSGQ